MLRHVISPARSFAQIPHAILRHPKLSADAKTLLTWQLSLPAGARQSLSETARKANIKKVAFQNAKRQLLDEGYAHEWRLRVDSGRCVTIQLVSNVPLSAKEALAVRDGVQPLPNGSRMHGPGGHRQPTAARPTAGQPTGRPACRQPQKDLEENTHQPTTPARAPESQRQPQPEDPAEHRDDGERLLRALAHGDRCPDCRAATDRTPTYTPEPPEGPGFAAFLAARQDNRRRGRSTQPTPSPLEQNLEHYRVPRGSRFSNQWWA